MFTRIAAAVIAVSLIAGPVLAQGPATATATTGQPAAKGSVKVKTTEVKVIKTKKHAAMHRHHRKHFAHVKHVKHVKYVSHGKHVKHIKQVKQPAKAKIAG
jgi:hypothetical protein